MKLIVGLGNTGTKYAKTRHNAGFLAVRWLAHELGSEHQWSENKRLESYVLRDQQTDLILAQPTTMMNESGRATRKLMDYYNLTPQDITIIHDDADLQLGDIRVVETSRTGAGHHGVLSVMQHIGPGFKRIRIGIGRPEQPVRDISNYVLGRLTDDERKTIESGFEQYLRNLLV